MTQPSMDISPAAEKPKILIVDDRPENLKILLATLQRDYAIIAATQGERALELATKTPVPDLILLDVMMPDLDGYQVCEQLKANPLTQEIPIIFISALEDAADEAKGFELGAVDYITKPFSPPVVKARIKSHLTLQRLNQTLMATNQDLAQVTRYKDEFLANMSHELRTPLNTILGFSEGLQDGIYGPLNEQQANALRSIDTSSQHLLSLINDILDLSKIVAGKIELQPTPTAIAELCRSSLIFVQNQALRKNIYLSSFVPAALDLVPLDERRIKQALINLLSNAVKFTPEGGQVSLVVTVDNPVDNAQNPHSESPSPRLLFQVKDTGVGISSDDQKHLFQPFVQINHHLNRQNSGSGLGLALVKQIAELHRGEVWVDSEVGKGCCFTLSLPLDKATTALSLSVIPLDFQVCKNVSSSPRHSKPLVLLAEDYPENRETLATYLNARRYRVIAAENGREAVALATSEHPDIILMDIQMPELDGVEAARIIRAHPTLAHIPIVAMTALIAHQDESRYLENGFNHCLPKPFRLKELTYIIDRLVESIP